VLCAVLKNLPGSTGRLAGKGDLAEFREKSMEHGVFGSMRYD